MNVSIYEGIKVTSLRKILQPFLETTKMFVFHLERNIGARGSPQIEAAGMLPGNYREKSGTLL